MAINTILLDFTVNPTSISDVEERQQLQSDIESIVVEYIPSLKFKQTIDTDGGFLSLYSGEREVLLSLRGFVRGFVSINIEYYKEDKEKPLLAFEHIRGLELCLRAKLGSCRSKAFPPVKRGAALDVYLTTSVRKLENTIRDKVKGTGSQALPAITRGSVLKKYFPTADERILEYDIDNVLYDERSEFQKILIVHSKSLGNLLVLDDLQNLSESDLIYTETLMQRGKEDYKDKEIVILGGGDGALLWELLKEKPKFVSMLEIDEKVIKACRKYMRSCCGTCLDEYKGENYEIIVEDCVKILEKMISEGRKFDYVFGDLTDIPISSSPQGEVWDFIRQILNLSMAVLKPTGKYMTHGNGASCPESLKMYEDQLMKLNVPVKFSRDHAFIPSFMEDWIFYQVSLQQN
ncbi:hypothetical protein R5R35_003106 [Gryllus longicercus]|uniref:PABS domain-containing protein n=1 Tax=Gryllus longicercus TaxID=2509291 RepID=A0AAN9VKX7_9ORTH